MIEMKEVLKMKKWAIVGASENKNKYGYKIYKRLKDLGYEVYPVNPNYEYLFDEKCYPNIKSLPIKADVINMVVSPKHGIKIIEEAGELGIKYIWLQPGTVNKELLDKAKEKGLETIQACVLIESK